VTCKLHCQILDIIMKILTLFAFIRIFFTKFCGPKNSPDFFGPPCIYTQNCILLCIPTNISGLICSALGVGHWQNTGSNMHLLVDIDVCVHHIFCVSVHFVSDVLLLCWVAYFWRSFVHFEPCVCLCCWWLIQRTVANFCGLNNVSEIVPVRKKSGLNVNCNCFFSCLRLFCAANKY